MKKDTRKNKGITLIALVITIVILIILAGISISSIFGSDGILVKAKYAAFATEMKQIEENVQIKSANIITQQILQNREQNLFDETLEQRTDIKVADTLKQEIMYVRDGLPKDKTPSNYKVQNFDIKGIYVIDKETGNGKKDTYVYDEKSQKVFKIPQTNIGGKIYHSIEGEKTNPIYETIQDEANVVIVDNEYYYEPDLKGFNVKSTQIVYYSSDFSKQYTKVAEQYINEGKKNIETKEGEEYKFHSYGKQQWANIKTTANGLESWWVWIPRYAYKVNGTANAAEPIGVIYVDLENKPLNPKYEGVLPEGYVVHPSFTPSGEDEGKKLKGIWMSKYEPSHARVAVEANLDPDMEGFDKDNTYIELYDSETNTFSREVKLAEADLSTINNNKEWHNYKNQQYANIKTIANGLESWWVWIPRYAYKIEQGQNSISIIFIDENNNPINNEIYPYGLPEEYIVHPAFEQSKTEDGKGLKGIWMSKYEPSQK